MVDFRKIANQKQQVCPDSKTAIYLFMKHTSYSSTTVVVVIVAVVLAVEGVAIGCQLYWFCEVVDSKNAQTHMRGVHKQQLSLISGAQHQRMPRAVYGVDKRKYLS